METNPKTRRETKVLHLGEPAGLQNQGTQLPNENELGTVLWHQLLAARADGDKAHLMLCRISNMQQLIDTFGADFGNAVEFSLLYRVQRLLRRRESVQRLSSGEFGIAARGLDGVDAIEAMARRLLDGSTGLYEIDGLQCRVQLEISAASCPEDSQQPGELLHFARFALRDQAKPGSSCKLFSRERLKQQKSRLWLEAEMERALQEGRFVLEYQPQYSVSNRGVAGIEALVRLKTVDGELIAPNDFIPLAEDNGFIVRLGQWVIREACLQLASWRRAGCKLPRISVNVSPRQLLDEDLLMVIDASIAAAGLVHTDLELEITEQCVIEHAEAVGEVLQRISERGVRVAIDDFGTGYSSFAYLAWQPLDIIKMDRSFLAKVESDPRIDAIVSAMIKMAGELGLEVLAEGVETEKQEQFLREQGCELAQGFALARPQAADAITQLLMRECA